jgi:hypothetical protein
MPVSIYKGNKIVGIAKNNKEADKIIAKLSKKEIAKENKVWRRKKRESSPFGIKIRMPRF